MTMLTSAKLAVVALSISFSLLTTGCTPGESASSSSEQQLGDRRAIEGLLSRANLGFELRDPDLFANAFADDAVYELTGEGPVFGYQKMKHIGRDDIRIIITDRLERARNTDPSTLSYDPATHRRYNRNADSYVEILDADTARHISSWMVVMRKKHLRSMRFEPTRRPMVLVNTRNFFAPTNRSLGARDRRAF